MNYMRIEADREPWTEFVRLATSEIFGAGQVTVYYDELLSELPTELVIGDQHLYLSPDLVHDFRMDAYATADSHAVAEKGWVQ